MGESACLMHSLSFASGISNEPKQGNPMPSLGESISFGRFMTESLSWEKWSTFSHKRYVEEAERYAQPGSVAQKKAFFEAHYKSIAAKKAAALLEQANAANNHPEPETEGQACGITTHDSQSIISHSQVPVDEQLKVKALSTEVNSVTEHEFQADNSVKNQSLIQLENIGNQNMVSDVQLGESSPQMEKPLLEGFKSNEEAPLISKKKTEFSSKPAAVQWRPPKVPASPAKPAAPIHGGKENNVTPPTRKSTMDTVDKKRSTPKSLHELINSTSVEKPDKSPTPVARRIESSRVAPSPYRASKDCKTPLRTPMMASANGVLKHPSTTPCSENRRSRTPIDSSASGSKTTGPKWHIISAVCSKSLSACRNKLQSPTLSIPFSLRTEERAARRKQKLEEKFNAKETQKVQLQTRLKEKAETEFRKLRQSLCFKAQPLPDFYKETETPKDKIKNIKAPLKHPPQSSKPGRKKPSSNALQGITSPPQETASIKSHYPKNVSKKKSQTPNPLTSLPDIITHDNKSPNILH